MQKLVNRFYDLIMSIYLYNEYNGYRELALVLEKIQEKLPEETELIAAVKKHYDDEYRHFQMFANYFAKINRHPFKIDQRFGYIHQLIEKACGHSLKDLYTKNDYENVSDFYQIFRLIMVTEKRGMKQVDQLLKNPLIKKHAMLTQIFKVVEKDEPSHCYPYYEWLKEHDQHTLNWREKLADIITHYSLILYKIPMLYLNAKLNRVEIESEYKQSQVLRSA